MSIITGAAVPTIAKGVILPILVQPAAITQLALVLIRPVSSDSAGVVFTAIANSHELRDMSFREVLQLKTFKPISIATSVVCLVAAGFAYVTQGDETYPARDYIMVSLETFLPANGGAARLVALRSRWVKAGGAWKEVYTQIRKDQAVGSKTLYSRSDGMYLSDQRGVQLVNQGSIARESYHSTAFLRKLPQLNREDSFLGFKTFVTKSGAPSGDYLEYHYAPEVGEIPIKVVMHSAGGDTVIEAVKIDFVEVSDGTLSLPDEPIKLDLLTQLIEQAEKQGRSELAEHMRQLANNWQQPNKQQ
jgi:hypothetical protein